MKTSYTANLTTSPLTNIYLEYSRDDLITDDSCYANNALSIMRGRLYAAVCEFEQALLPNETYTPIVALFREYKASIICTLQLHPPSSNDRVYSYGQAKVSKSIPNARLQALLAALDDAGLYVETEGVNSVEIAIELLAKALQHKFIALVKFPY